MKKFIIVIAIIMIAVLAFGAFGIGLDKVLPEDSSDTVSGSGSETTGMLNSDTSTSTEPSVSTDVIDHLYTYHIDVYKQGTSTLISDFDVESNSETATLSYSGNTLTFKSADAEYTVSYTSIKTIDSISVTRVTPGTTSVYITYTPTSSETTHTHSYTVTKAATCTISGVETCTCGETQTIAATGHSYSETKAATCTTTGVETCTSCGATNTIAMKAHSFIDYIDCAPGSTYYCIICGEHSNIQVSHSGDSNGDGVCDSCGWEI